MSWAQVASKNLPPSSSAANSSPATNVPASTTANPNDSGEKVPPPSSDANSSSAPDVSTSTTADGSNPVNDVSAPNDSGENLPPPSSAANSSPATNVSTSTAADGSNPANNVSSPNGDGSGGNSNLKQQIENLKSMRDSLFATDGWGGEYVNQDSRWDVPSSPEPAAVNYGAGAATSSVPGKPNVDNGTDLWEANLRNKGQPPPQSSQNARWGYTPTNNLGGTWGEVDDGESPNVWSGPSSAANAGVQQWGNAPSNPMPRWDATENDDWGHWNGPKDIQHPDKGVDPRNTHVDPSHQRSVVDHRNINDRGGVSGRNNDAVSSDLRWRGPQPPGPGPHHHVTPTGPYPAQASTMVPPGLAAVSHWNEMGSVGGGNMGRNAMQCPPGSSLPQNRTNPSGMHNAAGAAVTGMKPDQLWSHPNRTGAWGDSGPRDMNAAPWAAEGKIPPWNEPGLNPWNSAQKPNTPNAPSGGWNEGEVDPSTWGHVSKMGPRALTKDYIWSSKQFKNLSEMNFKKEDIENALRASNMNLEDAFRYLNAIRAGSNVNSMDGWRRHEIDAGPFDQSTNQAFSSHRFNPQQQSPFAAPPGGNGGGGNGANTFNISNLNPASVQEILARQPPSQPTSIQSFDQPSRPSQNQPSAHQLRMLVQQLQLAVSAGYLHPQIMNQSLAPSTLVLLNSLLQQINNLQQLQRAPQRGKPMESGDYMACSVKQQQCKQLIQSLQNQITASQSAYLKQLQQQQPSLHNVGAPLQQGVNVSDLFKQLDPASTLRGNFNDLALKDPQMAVNPGLQNQSKLNQWRLPASMDKDEFGRAPSTTTKSMPASGSANLNPFLLQTDSAWSNVANRDGRWRESVGELSDSQDWASPASATNFTDLVPEFEPGKPWKGNQMISVEDDPYITPGSVGNPLLTLSTMKDADIFNNPSNAATTFGRNESKGVYNLGKVNDGNTGASNTGWGDANAQAGAVTNLWGAPSGQSVNNAASNSNRWGASGESRRWPVGSTQSAWMGSSWLVLRNLTPQIDGSTLKTLCMQHGPLNNFHLFLNHGIALAKYSSRDEASKAQVALNNCVLGNTTIFAESPPENEMHTLLQQLNQQSTSANDNWSRIGGNNQTKPMQNSASAGSLQATSNTWSTTTSQLWSSPLWGAPQSSLETPDPHQATSSSLNSFLAGDLWGGKTM